MTQELTGLEIAVIGMSGRFPGAAGIERFWDNIKNGNEGITFYSDEELLEAGVDGELLANPNYVKAQPWVEDIDCFDAFFFDYSPREAGIMDPQLRVFHECVWHALEDGGYDPYEYDKLIGCYAGASVSFQWQVLAVLSGHNDAAGVFEARQLFDKEFLCTRVAYKFNLRGPGVLVQSACSTSLVAIHMACQGLINGECDIALSGGVSIPYLKKEGYLYREGMSRDGGSVRDGMIFSSDGHCKVFDARADGTVFGNGCGVVLLKRLEDAIEDRDNIYAIVKGSFINNDGSNRGGYTAPSPAGEAAVIRTALQLAEVEPETVGYVETHSTGTALGGPIEVEGLSLAFGTEKRQYCALGCVKTIIGHLNIASGVAGFIKTVKVLQEKIIPPNLHFQTPDPAIDFENSPFYVADKLKPWETDGYPRRAGVSSFGIGGTNAHVVLEEWNPAAYGLSTGDKDNETGKERLLVLSARTRSALDRMSENLGQFLQDTGKNKNVSLTDIAYTLMFGRKSFGFRRFVTASTVEEAAGKLLSDGFKKAPSGFTRNFRRPLIFMFSGLGGQYVDMGRDLYEKEPVFREAADRCFEICRHRVGEDIKETLYPGVGDQDRAKEQLNRPANAQLAVFIFEYALARLVLSWGVAPHGMTGYSFGEYTAACIAGVLSLEDALYIIIERGKLVESVEPGIMLSIPLPKEEVFSILERHPQCSPAIDNGPSYIVGGPCEAVEALESELKERKLMTMRIQGARALHSRMMEPVMEQLAQVVSAVQMKQPQIPYVSNVTGDWITSGDLDRSSYWADHLSGTVRFAEGVRKLMETPEAVFVEIGPGRDLTTLLVRHLEGKEGYAAVNLVRAPGQSIPDRTVLLNRLGRLWLQGAAIDWNPLYADETPYRVSLPLYPFEQTRFPIKLDLIDRLGQLAAGQTGEAMQPGVNGPGPSNLQDIVRQATTAPQTGRPELETGYIEPRDAVEQAVASAWGKLFGFSRIGIDDDFFELGGDSLKATIVINAIQKDLGVEIPLDRFFKAPTVRAQAELIRQKGVETVKVSGLQAQAAGLFGAVPAGGGDAAQYLASFLEQPMVVLNPPGQNDERRGGVFCFPSALAFGMVYQALASQVSTYTFYSFHFLKQEDRAAQYADVIMHEQPNGPIVLFEYSAGVRLAFETAKELETRGRSVSDIILVDSFWPIENLGANVSDNVINGLKQYLEGLGAGTLSQEAVERVTTYRRFFVQPVPLEPVHANLHLILSEPNKDTPKASCWKQLTRASVNVYQGFGAHDDMLNPGEVEKNAPVIEGILDDIMTCV